jgi:hypothetical protein
LYPAALVHLCDTSINTAGDAAVILDSFLFRRATTVLAWSDTVSALIQTSGSSFVDTEIDFERAPARHEASAGADFRDTEAQFPVPIGPSADDRLAH